MKRITLIHGFWERVDIACHNAGLTKAEAARRMGKDRHALCNTHHSDGMSTSTLLRFCRVTGASADWLLGLKEGDANGT